MVQFGSIFNICVCFEYISDKESSRWLWIFNHNTCENCLEEVQGSATSSLFTQPLFQNMWQCVQLLCAERNAPCQRDLAVDKAKLPASAAKWQGNDQTDLQCQGARHCHYQIQWATCAAWHWGFWTSFWRLWWYGHVERSNGAVKIDFDIQVSACTNCQNQEVPGLPSSNIWKSWWLNFFTHFQKLTSIFLNSHLWSLFVLRFYGPVNPFGSCRALSIYLTTRLLGRLSPLSGLPVLCTFFRHKLTTALLESAEGREWP